MRSLRTILLGAMLVGVVSAAYGAPCAPAVGPSEEEWSITRAEPVSVFADLAARPVEALATPRPVRRGVSPAAPCPPAEPAALAVVPLRAPAARERSLPSRPTVAALTCVLRI